jgi:hypothetical protein
MPSAPGLMPPGPGNVPGGVGGLGGVGGAGLPAGLEEEAPKKITVAVVSVALDKQPFEEAFRQIRAQVNINLVLDPALGEKAQTPMSVTLLNAPLDSALLVLTELGDVDFVWLDNVFFVTSPDKAKKLKSKWPDRRGGNTLPPQAVGNVPM